MAGTGEVARRPHPYNPPMTSPAIPPSPATPVPRTTSAGAAASSRAGLYSRLFAALYDLSFRRGERAGMAERRAALLAGAKGRVLEIGAGTGLNLPFYPAAAELVLTEPEAPMARRLERRVAARRPDAAVVIAGAEELPFDDASFDVVVSTLVLCTVPEPQPAAAEAARVLKPGGKLLFIEHVRAPAARLARLQDRLDPLWRHVGNGCHCNRDTLATLRANRFELHDTGEATWHRMPRLIRPLAHGVAAKT
jgi:SAM-dependent methyltransferase